MGPSECIKKKEDTELSQMKRELAAQHMRKGAQMGLKPRRKYC